MKNKTPFAALLISQMMISCILQPNNDFVQVEPRDTPIPTPVSIDVAIKYATSDDHMQRIIGMWSILEFSESVSIGLPFVIENLSYPVEDVRINAARVLAEFGPSANEAVPSLISTMQTDSEMDVKIESAIALGLIQNGAAVPFLANNLYSGNESLAVSSAKSISHITGVVFPDSNSSGYTKDENGNPYILLAAKEWWEQEGKNKDWPKP